MNDLHQSWGAKIRIRRQALNITQARFAAILGITQSTVSKIERGEQCPSDSLKWKVAGALGVTVEALFPYPAVVPPFPSAVAS